MIAVCPRELEPYIIRLVLVGTQTCRGLVSSSGFSICCYRQEIYLGASQLVEFEQQKQILRSFQVSGREEKDTIFQKKSTNLIQDADIETSDKSSSRMY